MPQTLGIVASAIATETQARVAGNGNYIYCADTAAMELPVDFDVAWFGSLDTLTGAQSLLHHFYANAAGRSWYLRVGSTNIETFTSTIGSDQITGVTAPKTTLTAGVNFGLRYTRRKSDGLSRIYTSPSDPPVWTKVGEAVISAGSGQFDSTGYNICMGGHTGGTSSSPTGYFRRAEMRNGFELTGSIVASPDARNVPTGSAPFCRCPG